MTDLYHHTETGDSQDQKHVPVEINELNELKRILTGPLEERVASLQKRLDDNELRSAEISSILPDAIRIRTVSDDKIGKALESTITSSIKASIRRDRKIFADVLFPILGPAIRRAIASVILGMLQSFNQVLEQSLSIKGIKWRFEAFRTKRPFAEIVLLKTLLFQVEQIFLIHHETGLVLQHVVGKEITAQDPDLVSAMLTAIQDFVDDSFNGKKEDNLDTLRMGIDRSVWIERGAQAFLAVVIRGTPPLHLREDFRELIEDINRFEADSLEEFNGDTEHFEVIRPRLESCLQYQVKEEEKRFSPAMWACLAVIFFLVTGFSFVSMNKWITWKNFTEILENEPGIVVTKTEKFSGMKHVYGFRDPYAAKPGELLKKTGIKTGSVIFHFEPYNSFHSDFLLKRVKKILQPDKTVNLRIKEKKLFVEGEASHGWIKEAIKLIPLIPGIDNFDVDGLIDSDQQKVKILINRIEEQKIYFDFQKTELSDESKIILNRLSELIKALRNSAGLINKDIQIEITGHTDSTGKESANMKISEWRAMSVLAFLKEKGVNTGKIITQGVSSTQPQLRETTEGERAMNRYVSFKVLDSRPVVREINEEI